MVTLVVIAVVVIAVILFGFFGRQDGRSPFSSSTGGGPDGQIGPGGPAPVGYSPEVPSNAVLTPPKNETPASANPELDTKQRFFDLRASRSGFEPSSFTVNSGDTLQVDFTAVDGDYDLDIPYLGAYFSVVREGETRRLPFDTSLVGTFDFMCRDYCPGGKVIKGQLIVLP